MESRLNTKQLTIILIIVLVISASLITTLLLISNRRATIQQVNLNEYIIFEASGYDGYGSIKATIDLKSAVEERVKTLKLSDEDRTKINNILQNSKIQLIGDDANTYKNGDIAKFTWPEKDLKDVENIAKVDFIMTPVEHTVSGLTATIELNPFDNLIVETTGNKSGSGALTFTIKIPYDGKEIVWKVNHDGKNGELKNDDVLNLSLDASIDLDQFTRETGYAVIMQQKEYHISCLREYANGNPIYGYLSAQDIEILDTVAEDWIVSGLNDENKNGTVRGKELLGYIYYTNDNIDEPTQDPQKSMLCVIYKISDTAVPEGYYAFIGYEGIFSYDYDGVYVNDTDRLPDSFIHYEKETVRYSEKFGWGQDYEAMGFMYYGTPYAGKLKLNETVEYLDKTYGVNYSYRHVSDRVAHDISIIPSEEVSDNNVDE